MKIADLLNDEAQMGSRSVFDLPPLKLNSQSNAQASQGMATYVRPSLSTISLSTSRDSASDSALSSRESFMSRQQSESTLSSDLPTPTAGKEATSTQPQPLPQPPPQPLPQPPPRRDAHRLRHTLAKPPKFVPQPIIDSRYLADRKMIKIAIRRKMVTKKLNKPLLAGSHSKLHLRSLEAGLRIKLTLAPSIELLYRNLVPNVNVRDIMIVGDSYCEKSPQELNTPLHSSECTLRHRKLLHRDTKPEDSCLVLKNVQLVDNNLVNLAEFPRKVLQTFRKGSASTVAKYPIFNCLDTAVHSLFGIDDYTLVRATKSKTDDPEGSTILKLEAARPGHLWLIDDADFYEEMLYSIGAPNMTPSNLFIKKILARPRYKADMKIYMIPTKSLTSLYTDERMLERDLINGVVDCKAINARPLLTTFDYRPVWKEIDDLVDLNRTTDS